MGTVRSNRVAGRDYQAVNGWQITASVSIEVSNTSPPENVHTSYTFGALNSANVAIYKSHCATAHSSGRTVWLAGMPSGFQAWFNNIPNIPGLSTDDQDGIFECFRYAGEHGLDP